MRPLILFIVFISVYASCHTPTDSKENSDPSFNLDAELLKRSSDTIVFFSHLQIDSVLDKMILNDTIATTLGKNQDNTPYLLLARIKPGAAEIHEQVDDVAIIRSGHGTLKCGHQVSGNIKTVDNAPWRNWFCDRIENATERKLSPGDFIIIPAMTAHQYVPDSGDTLIYLTIKVKHYNTHH